MNEYGLSKSQIRNVLHVFDDLKVQSEMFDMDIDIETTSLIRKRPAQKRTWLDNWKDKVSEGDDGPESEYEAYA